MRTPEQLECRIVLTVDQIHFSQEQIISTFADAPYAIVAADLDGDGDLDLASASNGDNRIVWYENLGHLTFAARTISTSAEQAESIFAIDLDHDGDIDLLSASSGDNRIAWYENQGQQSFTTHTISRLAESPISVFAVDVDGDGHVDVLSASLDNQIIWYRNDGYQNFTAITIDTESYGAAAVSVADLDQDGDLDILAASSVDSTIAWFENDGGQNFTKRIITSQAAGAFAVTTADIDGDGDLDVVSASFDDHRVVWYENNGEQVFAAHTIANDALRVFAIFVADCDQDGDLDLFSASAGDNRVTWYENDGHQVFTARTLSNTMQEAGSVIVADLDGDGDLDVIAASAADDKIALFKQQNLVQLSVASHTGSESESTVITVSATSEFPVLTDQTVSLSVTGAGITAADYALSSAVITIPAGKTTGSVTLTVLNDALVEGLETAILTLVDTSVGIDLGETISQTVTITSDDSTRLTIDGNGIAEGNSGQQIMTFDVTSPNAVDGGFRVAFSLVHGTTNRDDLVLSTSSPLEFTGVAGEVRTITVTLFGDLTVEPDETFQIQLGAVTPIHAGADRDVISGASATGAIFNDDIPVISIQALLDASEGQPLSAGIFRIVQSAIIETDTVVNLEISGTAVPGITDDYEALPLSVTIPAGQSYVDIPLRVRDDSQVEGTETVIVTIASLGAHDASVQLSSVPSQLVAMANILDNDLPQIVSPPTVSVLENFPVDSIVLTVEATNAPQSIILTYTLSGDDADRFQLEQSTGRIFFKVSPDYELPSDANRDHDYQLSVTVTANVFPAVSVTQNIIVSVLPINDHPPVLVNIASVTVNEGHAIDAPVAILTATDADLPAQNLQFSLTGPDAGLFTIGQTGDFYFRTVPDHENPADADGDNIYEITVVVSDSGVPPQTTSRSVTVHVAPINDHAPVFENGSVAFVIAENAAQAQIVGRVQATDLDQPKQSIIYTISAGNLNGAFAIDPATGQITVANPAALDFEVTPNFLLTVVATDDGAAPRSAELQIVISLSDIAEPPELVLTGSGVQWTKRGPPIAILPQVTVGSGTSLAGGVLTIRVNDVYTKRASIDQFQLNALQALGILTRRRTSHGELEVEVQLKSNITAADIQSALRAITFQTKGKGIKLPNRSFSVTLATAHGESTVVTQTIQVLKKPLVTTGK